MGSWSNYGDLGRNGLSKYGISKMLRDSADFVVILSMVMDYDCDVASLLLCGINNDGVVDVVYFDVFVGDGCNDDGCGGDEILCGMAEGPITCHKGDLGERQRLFHFCHPFCCNLFYLSCYGGDVLIIPRVVDTWLCGRMNEVIGATINDGEEKCI